MSKINPNHLIVAIIGIIKNQSLNDKEKADLMRKLLKNLSLSKIEILKTKGYDVKI